MKLCTKIRVAIAPPDGSIMRPVSLGKHDAADIIDVSLVPDDHPFGVDSEGFLHIEDSTKEAVRE
jgi:hypothetical protein